MVRDGQTENASWERDYKGYHFVLDWLGGRQNREKRCDPVFFAWSIGSLTDRKEQSYRETCCT